jgi:VCBS repeat-containing protein
MVFVLVVGVMIGLTGCGGGGGGSSTPPSSDTQTGYLIDSAVDGVEYVTSSGKSGTTSDGGKFEYANGDTNISFSIGGLKLPDFNLSNLNSDKKILPTDLVGVDRNNSTDGNVTKLLQILQSLDSDGDPSNGITINQATRALFVATTRIIDTNISTLTTLFTSKGIGMRSVAEARAHFESTLRGSGFGFDVDTVAPNTPTLTTNINLTETNTTQIEVNGEVGAKVFVNGVDINKTIGSNGKVTITLDTNATVTNDNQFIITLKDSKNNLSEELDFNITKKSKPTPTFTTLTINEDNATTALLTATDADGDTNFTFHKVSDPSNGSVTIETNGTFTYTPNLNYNGSDSFSYKVNDGRVDSDTQSVTVTINPINDAPSIDTTFTTLSMEDNTTQKLDINISDVEGDSLTLTIDSNDTNITVTPNFTNPIAQGDYNGVTLDFNLTSEYNITKTVNITLTLDDGDKNDTTSFDVNIIKTEIKWKGFGYNTVESNNSYTSEITANGKTYPIGTKRVWLDRNLGASQVCTAYNDSACYGDYYQWGRNADGHEKTTSSNQELNSSNQVSDITNVGHSDFLTSSDTYDYDWAKDADSNGSLRSANWSKTDGTSVCPVGYRVPTIAELRAETVDLSGFDNRSDAFESFLKLPSAGIRGYGSGSVYDQGSYGSVWSSSPSGSRAGRVYFDGSDAGWGNRNRAYGRSVRCLRD